MADDASLIFNILGRDKVGPVLAKVKAEVAAAADDQVKGIRGVENALVKARAETARLGEEFKRTGNTDVWKAFKDSEKNLSALEKMRKSLSGIGDEAGNVQSVMSKLGDVVGKNPHIAAGVAGAILIGAPMIGAAVNSAVLLGIGGGALAGGIVLAAKNSQVQSAWSSFGKNAMESLTSASNVFVGPLVSAAGTIGAAFTRIMPGIQGSFAQLAPLVEKLASGMAGLMTNIMPGINRAIAASGPILESLANHLPALGSAMSSFFDSMARGGSGALLFFDDLMRGVEGSIVAIGRLVEFLSRSYGAIRGFGMLMTGDVNGFLEMAKALDPAIAKSTDAAAQAAIKQGELQQALAQTRLGAVLTADQFGQMSSKINETSMTSDMLAGQMVGRVFNSLMSVDQAVLAFEQSQTKLNQSIAKNGTELDIQTAKGQANRSAVLAAVQANMANYQANVAVGMSATDAAAAYNANTRALETQMQRAGLTQQEIERLIGKYRSVPDDVNTNITMQGLGEAINGLNDVIRRVNGLDGRVVRTTVEEIHRTIRIQASATDFTGVGGHAKGGVVKAAKGYVSGVLPPRSPGTLVLAGEPQTGGEVFMPLRGITQERAMNLAQVAGDAYGFSVVKLGQVSDAIWDSLLAAGWKGDANDGMEALYGPGTGLGDVVRDGTVSEDVWQGLLAAGWKGDPNDGMEALYRPKDQPGSVQSNAYQITVNAGPGTSGHEVGARVVAAIKSFEKVNGSSWRN